jgi:membrane associated rhomboid family serine protease
MPFLPLRDDNPSNIVPLVNYALIAASVVAFIWQQSLPAAAAQRAVYSFGAIPAVLFGSAQLGEDLAAVPAYVTLVTSAFLHGGWMHLGGNMLYLWIFGNNVEDAMGHARYLLFYLACAVVAGLAHAFSLPDVTDPVIGASGAVSGVLGAYLLLHPRAHIMVLAAPLILRLPAWLVLLGWFAMQGISAFTAGPDDTVAWWAHIGGFVGGMALLFAFRRPGVLLFDRRRKGPWG